MNPGENILVCITQQKACERLIINAAKLRDEYGGELYVIHVAKNEWNFLDSSKEGEALEYLFTVSKSVGADLTVLKSDDIIRTISDFVKENGIKHIIMGESANDRTENKFYKNLKNMLEGVVIHVIA